MEGLLAFHGSVLILQNLCYTLKMKEELTKDRVVKLKRKQVIVLVLLVLLFVIILWLFV